MGASIEHTGNALRKLRPAPPSCQVPHFEDYLPVCGVSPTAQYLLPASRVSSLVQTGLGEATEVEAQELLRHEDVEAQASLLRDTSEMYIMWRKAAALMYPDLNRSYRQLLRHHAAQMNRLTRAHTS